MHAAASMPSEGRAASFLEVRGIHKRFGGVHALRGVDLRIQAGQVYHLLGENGCGKSTLIKIISGAQPPDAGAIVLEGHEHLALTPLQALAAGIETVWQDLSLIPNLTVAENIGLPEQLVQAAGRLSARLDRGLLRDTSRRALGAVGLPGDDAFLDTPSGELPLAVRQLVAIARAIATRARLVIMDEPTTSLTRREVDNLIRVVSGLQASGIAVIFVTHKLDECFRIGGEVIVFRDGACVSHGPIGGYTKVRIGELMTGRTLDGSRYRQQAPGAGLRLQVQGLSGPNFEKVDLQVHEGEILGITGLMDSGRNELALALAGVRPARSGSLHIDGKPVAVRSPADAIRAGIGYVPEDRLSEGLFLDKPILSNLVTLVLDRLRNRLGLIDSTRAAEVATRQVSDLRVATPSVDLPVQALSGGNQQRVLIGRWLTIGPRLLILHGPTVGVDVGSKDTIYRAMQDLAARGIALIVISDDLPELLGNCDRIVVLRGGRLAAEFDAARADEDSIYDAMVAAAELDAAAAPPAAPRCAAVPQPTGATG